jgi:hypothetical protein
MPGAYKESIARFRVRYQTGGPTQRKGMPMRKAGIILLTALAVACGGPRPVQTVSPVRAIPPQPARDATGNIVTQTVLLPEGTEVSVQTLDFLTSQTANLGDAVNMEVDENVIVDNVIAIPAGTKVRGSVGEVQKAGHLGKSGSISVRVETTETADGQRLPLRATKAVSENAHTGSMIALSLIVSPLFLLRKGNDVAYQPGTKFTAYTDQKLTVQAWKR